VTCPTDKIGSTKEFDHLPVESLLEAAGVTSLDAVLDPELTPSDGAS
jgi:hypothetical protein